jgi:formyltetrahydrofolate deformylase
MAADEATLIALVHGPDREGLVARTAGWIYGTGGNIIHADLHRDPEVGVFFQRIEWIPARGADVGRVMGDFVALGQGELGMNVKLARSTHRPRVGVMVSKIPHCFHDIMLRFQSEELRGDVACVVSNHSLMQDASERYGVPFHHVPVTKETKPEAEARQLEILRDHDVELVLMARYMQVLSGDFLKHLDRPVINIHHSFLPAFAGGRPYHQAYRRGVKLIGATAHYATTDLDEGPIISQDVTHISHRQSIGDLVRRGSDLEKVVFARAVRCHLENRILVYDNKTVVFD